MRWQAVVMVVSIGSTFLFLSVFWWALQRRRERESHHRHQVASRLIEAGGDGAARALAWLAEQARADEARRRQGVRLAGVAAVALGAGSLVSLERLTGEGTLFAWLAIAGGAALLLHLLVTRSR